MTSKITESILRDWKRRGVTVREAAAEIGLTRQAVMLQEQRFDITLKRGGMKRGGQQCCRKKAAIIAAANNTRVKAWSCRPAAILRALEQRGMQ